MKIQQLSLFVENKPGHTAAPARLLANEGIDIRAWPTPSSTALCG